MVCLPYVRKSKLRRVAMARKVTPRSIIASNWPPTIWNRWSSSCGLSAIAELLVILRWNFCAYFELSDAISMHRNTSRMMQRTTVLCTNTMVFAVRPWLLLETRLVLEQMQSDPQLLWEIRLILDEIWCICIMITSNRTNLITVITRQPVLIFPMS